MLVGNAMTATIAVVLITKGFYIKGSSLEVGAGLGGKKANFVIVFRDASVLERMLSGGWRYESGAIAALSGSLLAAN